MLIISLFNIFFGIFIIVLVSKLWEKLEGWFYGKLSQNVNKRTLFLFMTLIIFGLFFSVIFIIDFIFHYSFINTMFVVCFVLLVINFFSPYYSSHMLNEERVFMRYAIKVSKDTPVTIFTLTLTPFLIASLGMFLIMIILTVKLYY
ncbi:hypothetical protein [Rossellomorea aquimaris]|uniref:hypothetical protein n=1 Tax=Rossellomorea aquimaris TaxID=189382 RepID=UPI001CFD9EA9|nr:hypothetical protein [Rossellomorea aquimaris]